MSAIPSVAAMATRYAVGRRSTAPGDVRMFIESNLAEIRRDAGCRDAILRAIDEAPSLGDDCDRVEWMRVKELLLGQSMRGILGAVPAVGPSEAGPARPSDRGHGDQA